MAGQKLNPSLFDKLTLDTRVVDILDRGDGTVPPDASVADSASMSDVARYNETAMRNSVRRELNWLLNTVNLAAVEDLEPYPQVKTSVLNYGLPDLTGRISTKGAIQARAAEIAGTIRLFEPRLDPNNLEVIASGEVGADNAVSYVIRGDVRSAVRMMPVKFYAAIEVETGEAIVRE
jgi:type VI secretion system protein ImpF